MTIIPRICITSPPDRERLVAEVFFDDEQFGEVNQESDQLEIEVYPKRSGEPWRLPFDLAIAALTEAKSRLVATRFTK